MAGLKPSFSVDFSANDGYFVSNMVVVLVLLKMAIVKQLKIVKQLINTGKIKIQRSFGYRCIVSKLNAVAKKSQLPFWVIEIFLVMRKILTNQRPTGFRSDVATAAGGGRRERKEA